ncbi:phage tail protein [Frankia gtarii]|uniref:phage tail protein n=1 Tax=Frankia gtarii TaxID=2950102 RepID=UPI0021C21E89|nr:phage tail protein [Frankia gtarii]
MTRPAGGPAVTGRAAGGPAATNSPPSRPGPANGLRFDVTIGAFEIGAFIAIEGLEASYEVKTYDEGGQNGFQHQLLGRVHYQNVKLTRPIDADSRRLSSWFSAFQREAHGNPTTATITAFDDNHRLVAEWTLVNVCPVRYSGPRFSAADAKIATETLEFAHQGFQLTWPKE